MMNEGLDHLFARLAATPVDRSLADYEAEVGRAIRRRRAEASIVSALGPARFASIGRALAVGVTVGAVATKASILASRFASFFSAASDLAFSTLLEGAP